MHSDSMQETDHNPDDNNNECLAVVPERRESSSDPQRKVNSFASRSV